jgi:hypothetical protein
MRRPRKRKGGILWLQDRLKQLAQEANECQATVGKALKRAVHYAVDTGDKLNEAKRLLERLRRKLRKRGGAGELESWTEWLAANFKGSHRTANDYMLLARNYPQVQHLVNSPNVSTRMLLGFIRRLGDEEEEGAGDDQPSPRDDAGAGRQPTEYEWARQELRDAFRAAVKEWPKGVVLYLAKTDDFTEFLGAIATEVQLLAPLWLRAKRREEAARRSARAAPLDMDGYCEQERRAEEAWGAFWVKAWSKLKHRNDLTAYQKRKLYEWVAGAAGLSPLDRRRLASFVREGDEAPFAECGDGPWPTAGEGDPTQPGGNGRQAPDHQARRRRRRRRRRRLNR